jgi:hypothetical protein
MIILDEPTYRSHPGLNYSAAKALLRSPKHFQAALNRKFEPSREMLIGTAVHEAVLEGKSPSYIVRPADLDLRTKEGKEWKAKNIGKEIMSPDEDSAVRNAIKAVRESADAQYLLKLCKQREVGIIQNYNGLDIKGRLDAHGNDEAGKAIILDFKTTSSADPEEFGRKAFGLRYPMQTAWYQSLLALELGLEEPPAYFWLTVETQEPFDVVIYQPSEEAMEIGRAQMQYCVETYKACIASGKWPGYSKGILQLEVPSWERKRWLKQ